MDKQGSKIVFAGGLPSCTGQVIVADLVDRIFTVFSRRLCNSTV